MNLFKQVILCHSIRFCSPLFFMLQINVMLKKETSSNNGEISLQTFKDKFISPYICRKKKSDQYNYNKIKLLLSTKFVNKL